MGKGAALRLALIGLAAGCATKPAGYRAEVGQGLAPRPHVAVAAATSAVARPWEIGQWALYRTTRDGETAYAWFGVVAKDGCGTWVRSIERTPKGEDVDTVCVRSDGHGRPRAAYVILEHGSETRTVDFRAEPQVWPPLAAFVPAWPTSADLTGEPVDVAAGHFDGALRVGSDLVHPAVPFAGWLRGHPPSGGELELVAFGDSGAPAFVPEIAARVPSAGRERFPWYLSLGPGFVKPLGHGHGDTDGTFDLRGRVGLRLAQTLGLYADAMFIGEQRYQPDPTQLQSVSLGLLGLRWQILDLRGIELALRGGIGVGVVQRSPVSGDPERDAGFAASLGVGLFTPVVGRAGIDLEIADDTITTGAGMRHLLGFQVSLQLPLSIPFR